MVEVLSSSDEDDLVAVGPAGERETFVEDEEEELNLCTETLDEILKRQNAENVDTSQVSHLNLDRQRIGSVDDMVFTGFGSVTNLYVQHNRVKNLAFCGQLANLRFLCASNNELERVDGLNGLRGLRVLDVSHNRIARVTPEDLPPSLQFLMLAGNPCAGEGTVMEGLKAMPSLIEVDGKRFKSSIAATGGQAKIFSFRERRAVLADDKSDRVRRMELEVEAAIEREIELERARLKMSEDAHLSNEVERIRNTIETIHGGGSAAGCVNFRPAVDGLMHHARTEMINKVEAMKERCRIRRLGTQEYSEQISGQIAKMKQKLRTRPFGSTSRPSTANSSSRNRDDGTPSS